MSVSFSLSLVLLCVLISPLFDALGDIKEISQDFFRNTDISSGGDIVNSDFEDANSLEDTRWYTLTNSFGDSKARSYTGLSIKSGNAHSGKKYLSLTAKVSIKNAFVIGKTI